MLRNLRTRIDFAFLELSFYHAIISKQNKIHQKKQESPYEYELVAFFLLLSPMNCVRHTPYNKTANKLIAPKLFFK